MNTAVSALRNRLDPGSRALAAQDFRHTSQLEREPVPDYIHRLEQLFRRAYWHAGMSDETRETLLHSQLQEGLRYELMKAPAVSGSHTYRELCLAARNEEKRLAELAKRRQYLKSHTVLEGGPGTTTAPAASPCDPASQEWNGRNSQNRNPGPRCCFFCRRPDHLSRDCPDRKSGQANRGETNQVQTLPIVPGQPRGQRGDPILSSLFSSDSEEDIETRQVRVTDKGSRKRYAEVQLEGVPALGIIDSGSDITIVGGDLFRHIATVAKLRKSKFRKPDKVPRAYDGRTFTLDGKMELDVAFNGVSMRTPVSIKADALLLGEGVCRQLQIISYHPSIFVRKGKRRETGSLEDMSVPAR